MAKQESVTQQHQLNSIADLNLLLARLDDAMRKQNAPPAPAEPKPDPLAAYEIYVTQNVEYSIDDTRGIRQRSQMVIDDEQGWKRIEWAY